MIRAIVFASFLLFLCIVSPCYARSDIHIQCYDLKATYVTYYNQGESEEYLIVFEVKEENITELGDLLYSSYESGVPFNIYINGRVAQQMSAFPSSEYPPVLVYTPFPVVTNGGKTREESLAVAKSYCPSTLPEGKGAFIPLSEHVLRQNAWTLGGK